jgi:hypothetical protein
MNAVPPNFAQSGRAAPDRPGARAGFDRGDLAGNATSMRWAALGDAGAVVATLAGLAPEPVDRQVRHFPVLIREAAPWRRTLAENAVADLAAVMEPGMAALLAINARGADTRPAARALWQEYARARTAIVALVPAGSSGPLRSA